MRILLVSMHSNVFLHDSSLNAPVGESSSTVFGERRATRALRAASRAPVRRSPIARAADSGQAVRGARRAAALAGRSRGVGRAPLRTRSALAARAARGARHIRRAGRHGGPRAPPLARRRPLHAARPRAPLV